MKKRIVLFILIGAAALLALANCGGGGNPALDKFMVHYDNMIKIARDNKADPDKALKAVNEYQEQNKAEMESLEKEITASVEKDPMKALEYTGTMLKKTGELAQVMTELAANIKVEKAQ